MCGILVYASEPSPGGPNSPARLNYGEHKALVPKWLHSARDAVWRRGADSGSIASFGSFTFLSAVLPLRDPKFVDQPIFTPDGSRALAYSGEIYTSDGNLVTGNDTTFFWDQIQAKGIVEAVKAVRGEFSFVYKDGCSVYFGRDPIGCRSLMYRESPSFAVTSATTDRDSSWTECKAGSIYKLEGNTVSEVPRFMDWAVSQCTNSDDSYLQPLQQSLKNSIGLRVAGKTKVSILFSGGLDCTLLALLIGDAMNEGQIELVNVAFENARTKSLPENAPDRILAERSFNELQSIRPGNNYSLKKVNISYEEYCETSSYVAALIFPRSTVMDESIAIAFYFAAKHASNPVLFSGLGADELFGGYARHLGLALKSPELLASCLQTELENIWQRNLGRDDRVLADSAREARYPFLDLDFVQMAVNLPLGLKCDGNETKIALRKIARSLGLLLAAEEPKRAIQFGSRSAKIHPGSGRAVGTDSIVAN